MVVLAGNLLPLEHSQSTDFALKCSQLTDFMYKWVGPITADCSMQVAVHQRHFGYLVVRRLFSCRLLTSKTISCCGHT